VPRRDVPGGCAPHWGAPRGCAPRWDVPLAAVFLLAAAAAAQAGPPPCAYGDVVVAGDLHHDHATMLLDTSHRLPADAAPRDLVSVREAGFDSDQRVRAVLVDDLRALRAAAAEAGLDLAVQSAYRSFAYQERVHAGWVRALGEERARLVSARPGHSEHQLGTAIDLRSAAGPAPWDLDDWGATPEGGWVLAHAHRFGFVPSYPADAAERTCYAYEPWHLRWLGREAAAAVHASGLTLREWLYAHHPPQAAR
jgi:zinc D-Ala-D-Ala carboxypeptidase